MSNITQFTTGGVKSIQFGLWTSPAGGVTTVTISTVNPAKCMILVNGGYHFNANNIFAEATALTATVLTLYGPLYYSGAWYGSQATWQIIEFY